MEGLFFKTTDANGGFHRLSDVVGCTIASSENGFKTADLQLKRGYTQGREDLALNNDLLIGVRNNTAYNGRIDGITAQPDQSGAGAAGAGGGGSTAATANGYYASTRDLAISGTVSASATPEAMIASFLNSVYLPQLSTSTAGLLTTGITGAKYVTGNSGTDNEYIGDIIEAICAFGYAPSGTYNTAYRVVPAVWDGRLLVTSAIRTDAPEADYIVRKKNVTIGGLRRSLSNVYNRVVVRYKDLSGVFTITAFNDTASQAALASSLGGASVAFKRAQYVDWTSQGNLDPSAVSNMANALLNAAKQVKVDTDSITIARDYAVYSVAEGQEIPNWKVRAGKWLKIPDRFPRSSSGGTGTASGNAGLSTLYYISETSYDCFSGVLTLTPENSTGLGDFIS